MKFKFLHDFREFAVKGNVVDMAVGVIIGGAFGKIVSSLVADIIMPLVGLLLGGVNLADLYLVLKPETVNDGLVSPAIILYYGKFIQTAFDFLVIALSIFTFLRVLSYMQSKRKVLLEKRRMLEKLRKDSLTDTAKESLVSLYSDKKDEPLQESAGMKEEPVKDGKEDLLVEIRNLLRKIAEK